MWRTAGWWGVASDLLRAAQADVFSAPLIVAVPGSAWGVGSSILSAFELNWSTVGGDDIAKPEQTGLTLFGDRVKRVAQVLLVEPEITTWSPDGDDRPPNLDARFTITLAGLSRRLGLDFGSLSIDPDVAGALRFLGADDRSFALDPDRNIQVRITVFGPSGCKIDPRVPPHLAIKPVLHPECVQVVESIREDLANICG